MRQSKRRTASVKRKASPLDARQALLTQALTPVQKELGSVTQRMLSLLDDPVARKVIYLVTAGGKRLRPALVLLAGKSHPSENRQALIDTATAVELIHTATLIHDDIIDQSPLRRAQQTFHKRWGTERAVLMGDYLYSTAFALLASLDRPFIMQAISDVCQQLCRGELLEVEARFRLDLTESEYFDIIKYKTASLIGTCCECGAYLGGASEEAIRSLKVFGINFGIAFQIIDDCLDLSGDQKELGKSVLADLDKGALSLPIIYLTQRLSPAEKSRLFAPLRKQATHPAFLARIAQAAKASGALADAEECALKYIRQAQKALSNSMADGLLGACRQLAEYVLVRRV